MLLSPQIRADGRASKREELSSFYENEQHIQGNLRPIISINLFMYVL